MASNQTRLSINISQSTRKAIENLQEQEPGISVTEAIRRLVGVGDHVMRAVAEGREILFRKDGKAEVVVFAF